MGAIPTINDLIRWENRDAKAHKEGHLKTEAAIEVINQSAKELQGLPATTQNSEEARKNSSLEPSEGGLPSDTLIPSSKLQNYERLNSCFKSPTLQYFIMAALGNEHTHQAHILPDLPHFLNGITRTLK